MSQTQGTGSPSTKGGGAGVSVLAYPLGTLGALIGAGLGAFVMKLALDSGFYAVIAIGVLAGFGAGLLGRRGGWAMGMIAGVVTLAVGVWAEWKIGGPMLADDSFGYFVTHFFDLAPFKLLMHAAGIAFAIWFGARK